MSLYTYRSTGYITKWSTDGNVEASYSVSDEGCTCPAGSRPTCRHRQMLPYLRPIADTHWFLDWDNGRRVVDLMGTPKATIDALIEPIAEPKYEQIDDLDMVIEVEPTNAPTQWRRL